MKKKIFSIFFALVLVLTLGLVMAVPAAAATHNVASNEEIQDAIDTASDGDTIIVANGIYTGQLTITNKGLTITGESKAGVIVQTQADWTAAPTANVFTIDAGGYDVTIQNMTIRNGDYGIRSSAGNVNVLSCTLYHNGWDGTGVSATPTQEAMATLWTSGHTTDGGAIRIEGSIGSEVAYCTVYKNARGIRLSGTEPEPCLSPYIHHCVSHDNIESGIYLSSVNPTNPGVDNAIVEYCDSYRNMNNGLLDVGGKGNIWRNNNVHSNWNSGICITYPDGITFQNNTLENNNLYAFNGAGSPSGDAYGGVYAYGTGTLEAGFCFKLLNNTIANTQEGGLTEKVGVNMARSLNSNGIEIIGNTFTNHDTDVWVQDQAATTIVNFNNFGTVYGVINEDTPAILDATNNWWGNPNGPGADAFDGYPAGDAVSSNVDVGPWLEGPFEESTGAVSLITSSEKAFIGISVSPPTINFGTIQNNAQVPGSTIGVTNIGNVDIDVSAEIIADTKYDGTNYFFTTALKLHDAPCCIDGKWTASQLGLKPIAVNDSGSVSTKLVCPGTGIVPGETYTGTVVFWAVEPTP